MKGALPTNIFCVTVTKNTKRPFPAWSFSIIQFMGFLSTSCLCYRLTSVPDAPPNVSRRRVQYRRGMLSPTVASRCKGRLRWGRRSFYGSSLFSFFTSASRRAQTRQQWRSQSRFVFIFLPHKIGPTPRGRRCGRCSLTGVAKLLQMATSETHEP